MGEKSQKSPLYRLFLKPIFLGASSIIARFSFLRTPPLQEKKIKRAQWQYCTFAPPYPNRSMPCSSSSAFLCHLCSFCAASPVRVDPKKTTKFSCQKDNKCTFLASRCASCRLSYSFITAASSIGLPVAADLYSGSLRPRKCSTR